MRLGAHIGLRFKDSGKVIAKAVKVGEMSQNFGPVDTLNTGFDRTTYCPSATDRPQLAFDYLSFNSNWPI